MSSYLWNINAVFGVSLENDTKRTCLKAGSFLRCLKTFYFLFSHSFWELNGVKMFGDILDI